MLTCCLRSSLMVNDETPTSYFQDSTPGMIASNLADVHWVVRPSLAATALNRSTSKPMTVLPSVSRNSLGASVESVPMSSLPSALAAAGTFAASAWSTPEALVVAVLPAPLLLLPHAATTKVKPRPRASSRHLRALLNMCRPYRPGRRAAPQRPLISNCRIPCHATHAACMTRSGQLAQIRLPHQRVMSRACLVSESTSARSATRSRSAIERGVRVVHRSRGGCGGSCLDRQSLLMIWLVALSASGGRRSKTIRALLAPS